MDKATFDRIMRSIHGAIGQSSGPLFWLVNKVELTDPHVILEIGTGKGGSLRFWDQLVKPRDLVISVDINLETPENILWDWRKSDRNITIIVGDSTELDTVKHVEKALGKKEVDFLFLDGGHLYGHVSSDFRNYMPFVRSGGLVGFHDLCDEPNVGRFFKELEGKKEVSKGWMRPYNIIPAELPEKVGDERFMEDLKAILEERRKFTQDNGLVCTGIWWKS